MCSAVSVNELKREAITILRRVAVPESYLHRCEGVGSNWSLMVARNRFTKPVASLPSKFADAMLQSGWLEAEPLGRLVISAGGLRWLRDQGIKAGGREAGLTRRKRALVQKFSTCDGASVSTPVIVNDAESPLAWLATRSGPDGKPLLTQHMFDAGERLRADFELGQLGARVTASWDASILSGARGRSGLPGETMSRSETALAARQRVWKALESVGPGLSSVLLEVCCLASGLEAAERHLKWPKRSAKLVLVLALDRLADHYCMNAAIRSRHRAGKLSTWGLGDYRPELLGHLREAAGEQKSAAV
jgi:hypothetical protein